MEHTHMSVILRPYQSDLKRDIYAAWQRGAQNVLAVSGTGSGKTVVVSDIVREFDGASVCIAHRNELVSQISIALARNGVRHRIIGQAGVIKNCVSLHMSEVGRNYVDRNAHCAVAGVNTLVRMPTDDPWFRQVGLWVTDEAHHLLKKNIWGNACAMFPNARGLGVTATPVRADGAGLGRHADGIIDEMVLAPSMRDIINMGYLTEYRVFAPPSDIDLSGVALSAGGDYSPDPLRKAVHKSHVVGDIVEHYLRVVPGKLGITFAVDVESATEIAAAFRQAGVPAEVVTAKTPDTVRYALMRRFAAGELKQIVNVDLLGEGVDVPAVECVSMGRPTQSYGLFVQQFGRALRLLDGKEYATILDHVGNTMRHGLPDAPRVWTLDRREKRSRSAPTDVMPVRTCIKCLGVYEIAEHGRVCPYCSAETPVADRGSIECVDGDLFELDADTLARMRGEADRPSAYHPDRIIQATNDKRHRERGEAQAVLRDAMAEWAGRISTATDEATVRRLHRKFYACFGLDVLSAQALNTADTNLLIERVKQ